MGRNAITWEEKFSWDRKYIKKINFWNDLRIIALTVKKVFGKQESSKELNVTDDYGDYLLKTRKVTRREYDTLQEYARNLIKEYK